MLQALGKKYRFIKEYYETINNLKEKVNINIIFVKVDSHTDRLI